MTRGRSINGEDLERYEMRVQLTPDIVGGGGGRGGGEGRKGEERRGLWGGRFRERKTANPNRVDPGQRKPC